MGLNQPKRTPDEVLALCAGVSAAGLEAFYLDIRDSFALALTHAKVGAEQRREIVQVVDDYFANHYGDYDGEAPLGKVAAEEANVVEQDRLVLERRLREYVVRSEFSRADVCDMLAGEIELSELRRIVEAYEAEEREAEVPDAETAQRLFRADE